MTRVGDRAMTPGGRTGTVSWVSDDGHTVVFAYDEQFRGTETFPAEALHILSTDTRLPALQRMTDAELDAGVRRFTQD